MLVLITPLTTQSSQLKAHSSLVPASTSPEADDRQTSPARPDAHTPRWLDAYGAVGDTSQGRRRRDRRRAPARGHRRRGEWTRAGPRHAPAREWDVPRHHGARAARCERDGGTTGLA